MENKDASVKDISNEEKYYNKFQQVKDEIEELATINEKIHLINNLLYRYKFGINHADLRYIEYENELMDPFYFLLMIKNHSLYCHCKFALSSPAEETKFVSELDSEAKPLIEVGLHLKKIALQDLDDFIDDYLDSVKSLVGTKYNVK